MLANKSETLFLSKMMISLSSSLTSSSESVDSNSNCFSDSLSSCDDFGMFFVLGMVLLMFFVLGMVLLVLFVRSFVYVWDDRVQFENFTFSRDSI